MIAERDKLIEELKARIICRSAEQKLIQLAGRERVKLLLGGKETPSYQQYSRKYFAAMWQGYRVEFDVRSYRDTREKDFDRSTVWIKEWVAPGPLRMNADQLVLDFKERS